MFDYDESQQNFLKTKLHHTTRKIWWLSGGLHCLFLSPTTFLKIIKALLLMFTAINWRISILTCKKEDLHWRIKAVHFCSKIIYGHMLRRPYHIFQILFLLIIIFKLLSTFLKDKTFESKEKNETNFQRLCCITANNFLLTRNK